VVQVQLAGCEDLLQTPTSDTIVFDYAFQDLRWYSVAVSVDVSASGDGVARLYVDGVAAVDAGNAFRCPPLIRLVPIAAAF